MTDHDDAVMGDYAHLVDRCMEEGNHPTKHVIEACSPDPVLSHDGVTSQACRRCLCGRFQAHTCCVRHPRVAAPLVMKTGDRLCFECSFVVWLLTWMRLTFDSKPVPDWSGIGLYQAEHSGSTEAPDGR